MQMYAFYSDIINHQLSLFPAPILDALQSLESRVWGHFRRKYTVAQVHCTCGCGCNISSGAKYGFTQPLSLASKRIREIIGGHDYIDSHGLLLPIGVHYFFPMTIEI